jgi:outer membrane immunogenic protein
MNISRWLLGIAAVGVMLGTAQAADLPVKAPRLAPVAVYSWNGFYAGANAGYGWGDWDASSNYPLFLHNSTITFDDPVHNLIGQGADNNFCSEGAAPYCATKRNVKGVFGGVQAGFNWQTGLFVFGVEGDFQGAALDGKENGVILITNTSSNGCHGKAQGGFPPSPGFPNCQFTFGNQWDLNWFGTVRGRVGVTTNTLGFPSVLFYGTGGFAIGESRAEFTLTQNVFAQSSSGPCSPAFNGAGSGSTCPGSVLIRDKVTNNGWVGGGGIEAALDQRWSVKVEYLYLDLGDHTFSAPNPYCTKCSNITETYKVRENLVRVGVNMKFGGLPIPTP